ncbi:MAG: regulatory protein RecX [Ignavibacteriaceae bacterium]
MVILKIISKNEKNVVVTLEDGSVLFLSKDLVYQTGLRKGDDISEELRLQLIEENQKYFIKQKSFDYLSRRLHSTQELKTKLLQKKYDKRLIQIVLDELQEKKYLNDADFTERFITERIYFKKSGKQKIKSELLKKGIPIALIEEKLKLVIDENESYENALALGKKKMTSLAKRGFDDKRIRLKLFAFLVTKGYDFDATKQVCNALLKGDEIEE